MNGNVRSLLATAASVILAGSPATVWAADQASGAAQGQANDTQIQEVVITAQKTSQNLQNVPESVSALSGADLTNSGLNNVADVASRTPGLTFTSSDMGGSNTSFFIRGIGQADFISTADPGVGVYLDGVYLARTAGGSLDLLDVQRVEVLRGPQGTLFGKNAVGGAVSVITEEPSFDYASRFQMRAGELGRFDFGGTVSGPLVADKLAFRLTAEHRGDDGYGRSLYDNTSLSDQNQTVVRFTGLYKASPNFTAEASIDYTRDDSNGLLATVLAINPNTFVTIPQNTFAVANGLQPYDNRFLSPSPYENYSGFHPGDHSDIFGGRITLNWDVDWADLKSITAYRGLMTNTGLDYDGSPYALGDQSVQDRDRQFSQEIIASGKALDNRLSWVGGFYYLYENGNSNIQLDLSYQTNPIGFDTFTSNAFTNSTIAGYEQVTYNVTDKLGITGGLRYSHESKTDDIFVQATKFGVPLLPPTPQAADFDSTTYRVGLQYQFTRDLMSYASMATGFKSGGFNGRAQSAGQFLAYAPEKAKTYEIGAHTEWFDRTLRINADVYQTNYDNIQTTLNVPDPVTGVETNIIGNPADARIRGAELEAEAKLSHAFLIDLGVAYLENGYTRIETGADIHDGDHLPFSPKWNFDLGAQWKLSVPTAFAPEGDVTARADYLYRTGTYEGAQNSQYNYQGGYGVLNMRINYAPGLGPWEIAFYGKNVTGTTYYSLREDLYAFVYAIAIPAPPRELGVELNYTF